MLQMSWGASMTNNNARCYSQPGRIRRITIQQYRASAIQCQTHWYRVRRPAVNMQVKLGNEMFNAAGTIFNPHPPGEVSRIPCMLYLLVVGWGKKPKTRMMRTSQVLHQTRVISKNMVDIMLTQCYISGERELLTNHHSEWMHNNCMLPSFSIACL